MGQQEIAGDSEAASEPEAESETDTAHGGVQPEDTSTPRTGPPQFEDITLTVPDDTEVNEEWSVEVSARNTGGRTGDFRSSVTFGTDIFSNETRIRIPDIDPGTRGSGEVGPFTLSEARDYTVSLPEYAVSTTLSVQTAEHRFRSAARADGVTIRPENIDFEQALISKTDHELSLAVSGPDSIFAVITVLLENTADEPRLPLRSDWELPVGRFVDPFDSISSDVDVPATDSVQYEQKLTPGTSSKRYLIAEVPTPEPGSEFTLNYEGTDHSPRPEHRWLSFEIDGAPQFEADLSVPRTPTIQRPFSLSVTIRNTGSAEGTFRGVVESKTADADLWNDPITAITQSVPAGEEVTTTVKQTSSALQTRSYRLRPGGSQQQAEIQPLQLRYGEWFTLRTCEVRVLQPTIADTIEFQTDGTEPLTSSPTFHYQIFPVEVQATGEETFYGPQTEDFRLRNSTNGYTPVGIDVSRTLKLPACGGSVYDHHSIAEENTDSGYLVFETPTSVAVSDVKLSTTFDPELSGSVGAAWSGGPDSG